MLHSHTSNKESRLHDVTGSKRRRLKKRVSQVDLRNVTAWRLLGELDMYMNEPNVPEDSNPLNWWRDNYSKYPSVAVVARAFLGIPATSVAIVSDFF